MTADSERMRAELKGWWLAVAEREADAVVPKAIEYGATDLVEIGRHMVEAGVRVSREAVENGLDPELAELGVYFYMVGKMARWSDAIANGRSVSDDTLHDIGVYVRMVQRIRATGGWPGIAPQRVMKIQIEDGEAT